MPDFDLEELDTLTLAETGVPMPVINPRTRSVMLNDDNTPVTITLMGRHSEAFRRALKRIQDKRADMNITGDPITQEHRDREDSRTLIACTRDWTIKRLGKEPFPCTAANIRRLWTDERFRGLRETAMAFILTDTNFLANISSGSGDTLDTNFSSIAPFPAAAEPLEKRSAASA